MVVMDREDYIQKAQSLLTQPTYKTIDRDPTSKIKATLITTLRKIKKDTNLDEGTYKICILQVACPLKSMDYQKSIKLVTPLGLSYQAGVVTYGVAKVLTKVLKPLVGKSSHHIQSTSDFVNKAKGVTFQPGKCLTSYDVTSLLLQFQ